MGSQQARPPLAVKRASRQKLAERVAVELLEAIRAQDPGTRLPAEREMTEMLGVGRSTVREALNGLALIGAIEIRHGQGAFVAKAPTEDGWSAAVAAALTKGVTSDFLEARLMIEVEIARMAAQRRTADDLAALTRAFELQERGGGDLLKLVTTACRFHLEIAEAAHNEVLAAIMQLFVELMIERGLTIYADDSDRLRAWDLEQHRVLLDAVRAGNPDLAGRRMHEHVSEVSAFYKVAGSV